MRGRRDGVRSGIRISNVDEVHGNRRSRGERNVIVRSSPIAINRMSD